MMRFRGSNKTRLIFIYVVALALLFIIYDWATENLARYQAAKSPLDCARYAAVNAGPAEDELLCNIAVGYAEAGDFFRARTLLAALEEENYFVLVFPGPRIVFRRPKIFNLIYKAQAYASMAVLQAKSGRKQEALTLLSDAFEIIKRSENVYSMRDGIESILKAYLEMKMAGRALQLIDEIPEDQFNSADHRAIYQHSCLLTLVKTDLANGNVERAKDVLAKSILLAETMGERSFRISSFAESGRRYVQAGESQLGRGLLFQALGMIESHDYESEEFRAMDLTNVAEEMAKAGFYDDANNIALSIRIEFNRSDALKRVVKIRSQPGIDVSEGYRDPQLIEASNQILGGEREKGLTKIQAFRHLIDSGSELVQVVSDLAQAGEFTLAIDVARIITADDSPIMDAPDSFMSARNYRAAAIVKIALAYAVKNPDDDVKRKAFLRELLGLLD